jgi:hypothetical protein
MSSLLERAIIDATALKEAALKNAENLVIEKYSEEVRTAMQNLLEQDDDALADMAGLGDDLGDDLGDTTAEEDPFAAAGISDEPAMGDTTPDAEEDTDVEAAKEFADSTIGDIPDAFDPDLGDPDDEIINIKLDSLRAELPEEEEDGVFGGDDELSDDEISVDITDDEDELDLDSDLGVDDIDTGADMDMASDIDVDITPEMVAEVLGEMDIDEDIDVDELLEAVRVDFEPQKSGWAGTPESIMKEYEAMLLAREQDSKVKEENEELRKTVANLQKENKILGSAADKLKAQNEKFATTLEALQEKLETSNVSNAKLLYINRALENASLNERQKEKIVEAISKAETVQEAKIVFDTLQETITSSPAEKKTNSLSEAVSRRSTLLVAARDEQKERVASPAFDRLQRLAGIKK